MLNDFRKIFFFSLTTMILFSPVSLSSVFQSGELGRDLINIPNLVTEKIQKISLSKKIFIITNNNNSFAKGDFISLVLNNRLVSRAIVDKIQKNEAGIKNGFQVVDGSGLSLLNRVSPQTLTDVLSYAYQDKSISIDFLESLPVAGVDGTLKKRFRNSEVQGRVRAKTGYLNNVRALSGYIFTKNGDILVFSILSNGFGWKTKELQNDLLTQLIECCPN